MRGEQEQLALLGLVRNDDAARGAAFDQGGVSAEVETALAGFAVALDAVLLDHLVRPARALFFLRGSGQRGAQHEGDGRHVTHVRRPAGERRHAGHCKRLLP